MKCSLVIPSWSPEELFSTKTARSQINYWQPLGTLYVASALLQKGHEVQFLNGAFQSHRRIMSLVQSFGPRFVGIYSTAFGWNKARETATELRGLLPETHITAGGPFPVAVTGDCLRDCDAIDSCVTGEGELTVAEMAERIDRGKDLSGVRGTVFRKQGRIVSNPPRPLIEDLDLIPFPARELLGDQAKYLPPPATYKRKPVAVMITSRGCNRRCIFCFQIDRERKSGIRFRSIPNVLEEIEACLRQGYREIKFLDDTLAADYDRAMALAREITSRKLDFTWFASACVNQVDIELLRAFKKAGCWAILFGAESGVQKHLNTVRKGITLAQTRKAVRAAKQAGLVVYTPFIFGIPGETFDDGLKTIDFACELNPDLANFHALTPFPGTELYENRGRYGSVAEDWGSFTYQGLAFVPHTMTRDELARLRQIAFRRFYSRPGFLVRRLLRVRNANDLRAALAGMRSLSGLWLTRNLFGKKP